MNEQIFWRRQGQVFNGYSAYLKYRYGEPVYRVAVDGGFSCPNRGEDRSRPGCIYCDERGAKAPYLKNRTDLEAQIKGGMAFMASRYNARRYILYFQAFSGTYGKPEKLRDIYSRALDMGDFCQFIVSTRPDCLDPETVDVISSFQTPRREVWVELGLQSSHNRTLAFINRGHDAESFYKAYGLLVERGINITVHLIFGFPGESEEDILETVKRVSALNPAGIKIHNLHIPRNTLLFREYLKGEIVVPGPESHLALVIKALERLPQETVVMRLTCDTPGEGPAAPRRFWHKSRFYQELRNRMKELETFQGRLFS